MAIAEQSRRTFLRMLGLSVPALSTVSYFDIGGAWRSSLTRPTIYDIKRLRMSEALLGNYGPPGTVITARFPPRFEWQMDQSVFVEDP